MTATDAHCEVLLNTLYLLLSSVLAHCVLATRLIPAHYILAVILIKSTNYS